jgi:hypothetical protein
VSAIARTALSLSWVYSLQYVMRYSRGLQTSRHGATWLRFTGHGPHNSNIKREPGSSVSIVSDYGLDYRSFEVRFRAEAKDFSSTLCIQTGSGTHPASCTMDTGGPFPGGKRGQGVTLTTHPIYCRGREWVGATLPLSHASSWRVMQQQKYI